MPSHRSCVKSHRSWWHLPDHAPSKQLLVVPIDVGKDQEMALVGDFTGELLTNAGRK